MCARMEVIMEKRFLLVDVNVLPEVFLRVLQAKELLANGEAKNISVAARLAGVSRSAFYKYKDCIFDAEDGKELLTLNVTVLDETGALQALLAGISSAGISIVNMNQAPPTNGTAQVWVTIRTGGMKPALDQMFQNLRRQRTVVDIRCGV